jgi:YesN/AraC family two-component response regulator
MSKARMLIVDDEKEVRDFLAAFLLRKLNCLIEIASSGEEALEKLKKEKFDLVLIDIKMPGLSGIDIIERAVKFTPETKFLTISGYDSDEIAHAALKAGAVDFIPKPQTVEAIKAKVKDILIKIGKYEPKK